MIDGLFLLTFNGKWDVPGNDPMGRSPRWADPTTCHTWLLAEVEDAIRDGFGVIVINRPGGHPKNEWVSSNGRVNMDLAHRQAIEDAAKLCEQNQVRLVVFEGWQLPRDSWSPSMLNSRSPIDAMEHAAHLDWWCRLGVREMWLDRSAYEPQLFVERALWLAQAGVTLVSEGIITTEYHGGVPGFANAKNTNSPWYKPGWLGPDERTMYIGIRDSERRANGYTGPGAWDLDQVRAWRALGLIPVAVGPRAREAVVASRTPAAPPAAAQPVAGPVATS